MADPNLKIRITALNKTQQAFNSVQGGLKRVGKAVGSLKTGLLALGAGVGIKSLATSIDELAKSSARLGLTINQIQSLQFAASQSGASAEELEKGLTRFSRAISEANTGIGTGLRAFEMLGVSLTSREGELKNTDDLLMEVSDALKDIESPADRVRIAFDLFGRSGVNLVNALQDGSGAVQKLRDDFNAITFELTQRQGKAVEKSNDLFDALGKTLTSIGQQLTALVLPPLAKFTKILVSDVGLGFANNLLLAFQKLGNAIKRVVDLVPNMFKPSFLKDTEFLNNLFDDQIKKIQGTMRRYDELADGVGKFDDAQKGVVITVDQGNVAFEKLGRRLNGMTGAFERFKFETVELNQETKKLDNALEDVASRGLSSMEDGLINLVKGTESVSSAFRNMANSIIEDLVRMQIRKSITEPLFASIQSFITPSAGNPNAVPKFMADGGSVTSGRPYIVGERGAELFVPNRNGTIVPNDKLGGGSPVIVNQTINLTTGVSQTVRAEVLNMLPQISEAAKGAVLDAKRRGGQFSSVFGV